MLKLFRSSKGQTVSSEYVISTVLVVAAVIVMSTYIKRALQARAYDAQQKTIQDAQAALGLTVANEYEPYYLVSEAEVDQSRYDRTHITQNGGFFNKEIDMYRGVLTSSEQLAPLNSK